MFDEKPSRFAVNQSGNEQMIRIVLGTVLIAMFFLGTFSWWALLGFVPLITGATGYCPLYALLGVSTVGKPHRVTHA